jgi:hypothetical protein
MKRGTRVKIIYSNKTGTVAEKFDVYGAMPTYKVDLDADNDWVYVDEDQLELLGKEEHPTKNTEGCECGSWAVGSPRHSHFCKLFKEDESG